MNRPTAFDLPLFAPYQKHSATSRAAAEAINPGTLLEAVLDHIRGSDDGATDDEIQAALDLEGSTERPRRVRLVELGLVRDSGRTRSTRSGRQATVWEAA